MTGMMEYMINKKPVVGDWARLNQYFNKQEGEIIRVGKDGNVVVKFELGGEKREWLAAVGEFTLIADVPVPAIKPIEPFVYPERSMGLVGLSAITDRIERKVYINQLPFYTSDDKKYMTTDSIRAWRDAYTKEEYAVYAQFKADVLAAYNTIDAGNMEFWSKMYEKAWSNGHSEGLLRVAQEFDEFMDMFFGFKVVKEV